jgi:hypothetical protein
LKSIWISLKFARVSIAQTGLIAVRIFRKVYSGYCSIEVYIFHVGGNILTKYNT